MAEYKIYLDVCCLNPPFDDQTQPRIRQSRAIVGRNYQMEDRNDE